MYSYVLYYNIEKSGFNEVSAYLLSIFSLMQFIKKKYVKKNSKYSKM